MLIVIAFVLFFAMIAAWMVLPLARETKPADAATIAPALQTQAD